MPTEHTIRLLFVVVLLPSVTQMYEQMQTDRTPESAPIISRIVYTVTASNVDNHAGMS